MSCYLLTGGTGLLGTYLVRDLLRNGHGLALLVRGNRVATAQDRVNRILQHWENQGLSLPAPRVFQGNIRDPNLGLSPDGLAWVEGNCTGILHNAASVKFRQTGDEPWTSNVKGTEHVLRLAERMQVPEFHYVSSAYALGKTDVAYEVPIPTDYNPRNCYEESKRQAEQRVLQADLPNPPTVYRPSIIIGDSETGFTTTFHNIYAPLRQTVALLLAGTGMAKPGAFPDLHPTRVLKLMGLTGQERKNLVPVDWVSRTITRIVENPEYHGSIYHVTTATPTSVEVLQRTTIEFLLKSLGMNLDDLPTSETPSDMDRMICDFIAVYREYWESDPQFDTTGVSMVAPDDPCPVVGRDLLTRTFQFALDAMLERPSLVTNG